MPISIFKPTIKRRDMDAVLSCLVSEQIGPGPLSTMLVREAVAYIGIAGGFALREYKRSIELVLDAMEIGMGDAVIISPLSPSAYYDVCSRRGIRMLFADVDPHSACIDASHVEALLGENPAACVVDSPVGFVPDMNALAELNVPIIEDVTNCIGAIADGGKVGRFGRFVIIGLEEKNIITAGGGALALSQTKTDLGILRKAAVGLDQSGLLPDFNAALALTQLRNIEEFINKRRDIAQIYHRAIMKGRHRTFSQDRNSENVHFSFPVILDGSVKEVMKYARSKNIVTRETFCESILSRILTESVNCPNAQALYFRCILFPLYPMLGKANIQVISRVLSTLP